MWSLGHVRLKVIALDPRKLLRKLAEMEGRQALAARHSNPCRVSTGQLQPLLLKAHMGQVQSFCP